MQLTGRKQDGDKGKKNFTTNHYKVKKLELSGVGTWCYRAD